MRKSIILLILPFIAIVLAVGLTIRRTAEPVKPVKTSPDVHHTTTTSIAPKSPTNHPPPVTSPGPQIKPKTANVTLSIFNVRFASSESAGQVSYTVRNIGGIQIVPLIASRLKSSAYTCSGVNTGEFGYLFEITPATMRFQAAYKKEVGGKTYGLVRTIRSECLSSDLVDQFTDIVPATIVQSLEPVTL